MSKKIVVSYKQIEDLDGLLAMLVCPTDEEVEVTIVRLLHDSSESSEQLFSELKAVSAQIQARPNWRVQVAWPPLTA